MKKQVISYFLLPNPGCVGVGHCWGHFLGRVGQPFGRYKGVFVLFSSRAYIVNCLLLEYET
jgi:hypothetical protein